MKKAAFIMVFILMLSACAHTEPESEPMPVRPVTEGVSEETPGPVEEALPVPTPTPAPGFTVENFFTEEEMEQELQFVEYKDEYLGLLGFRMFLPADWHFGIVECIPEVGSGA